jgi:Transposase, Mutator family
MTSITTKPDSSQLEAATTCRLFDDWFDPIETEVRARARGFIEELLRSELDEALARPRYGRSQMAGNEGRSGIKGHRHGSRRRSLTGTFGPTDIAVPRARLTTSEGKTTEWKSQALRAYQRRTRTADALIASTYLAGTKRGGCGGRWRPCSAGRSANCVAVRVIMVAVRPYATAKKFVVSRPNAGIVNNPRAQHFSAWLVSRAAPTRNVE